MKRSRYTKEFKIKVVREAIESGNKSQIARRYVLSVGLVHRWVVEYKSGKLEGKRIKNNMSIRE